MEEAGSGMPQKDLLHFLSPFLLDHNYICQSPLHIHSRGIWKGDDPLSYSLPLFLLQISLTSLIIHFFYLLLKPLGQPLIVSQILGGVILGPSLLGRNSEFSVTVFPPRGQCVMETISHFGFMHFMFLIGVKIDPAMIFKSGSKALIIGVLCFFVPFTFTELLSYILLRFISMDPHLSTLLPFISELQSGTSFPVIACFLTDLNILNSEIGRLATSSSIICDACRCIFLSARYILRKENPGLMLSMINTGPFLSQLFVIAVIVFGIRYMALWMIRHTPEGRSVKDTYVMTLIVALLACGFMGEVIGMHYMPTAFLMGLVIPDGPPLAAALVDWLDCFISELFMPIFFAMCGLSVNIYSIQNVKGMVVIHLIVAAAFLMKAIAVILPLIFYRMPFPFRDAFSLALVLNTKGIIELTILTDMKRRELLSDEIYSIMIASMVILTGIVSSAVKVLYDPSRGYLAYKRRTFFHNKPNEELCILACIHRDDNVQAIVNILDASHPTEHHPINLSVLHLVNLMGRASSFLDAHRPQRTPSHQNPGQSDHIFNAFRKLEHQNRGAVTVSCFKGISPYVAMHNDICCIALERKTTLIVLPFHKHRSLGEWVDLPLALRHMNRKVLDKGPCSVGILIDRGSRTKFRAVIGGELMYRVAVLFFGGMDDREAVAYAKRMSGNPNVRLNVTRLSALTEIVGGSERSKMLDAQVLSEVKMYNEIGWQEEVVFDGRSMVGVMRSIETAYDLVMVGRRHGESKFMSSLSRWNECDELGPIGEMLAASELKNGASILVVQQQSRVWGIHDPNESKV